MSQPNQAYMAAHSVLQSLWGAVGEAPPEENKTHLWVMAAEVCQGFSFQMTFLGLDKEAVTFGFLQDLASVRAQIEHENDKPSILLPGAIRQAVHPTRIM